jgi:hypothetical protein
MREELESFVNKGIEEGWSGWPLKGWSFDAGECRLKYCDDNSATGLFNRAQSRPLLVGERFNRLFGVDLPDVDSLS